jgi:sensor histidine kinase YesM
MQRTISEYVGRLFERRLFKWTIVYLFFAIGEAITHGKFTTGGLLTNIFNSTAAIVNIEILIPRFLQVRKFLIYTLLVTLTIVFFSYTKLLLRPLLNGGEKNLSSFYLLLPTILVVIASMVIHLINQWQEARRKSTLADKEILSAKLSMLQTQLNPHFFFNSINSIYHLIDHDTEQAKAAIIKMSGLLRFQLDDCQSETISLSSEVEFLKDYIAFESIKHQNEIKVNFKYDNLKDRSLQIPPLLFLPFVENAFKHISHFENSLANKIEIAIQSTDAEISFSCSNTIDSMNSGNKPLSGIGLANVKSRLDLIYQNGHRLNTNKTNSTYQVNLLLPCKIQK